MKMMVNKLQLLRTNDGCKIEKEQKVRCNEEVCVKIYKFCKTHGLSNVNWVRDFEKDLHWKKIA